MILAGAGTGCFPRSLLLMENRSLGNIPFPLE